ATLTTSSLANLTMNRANRTLTIGNPLRIWGELTATTGTIACGNNVTIKADNIQKGRIAPIGTNADITGNITFEVFAKGGSTGWTLLGISGIQSQSFTAWSDNFPITCPTCPLSSTFTSIYQYCESCATNNYSAAAHYVPMSNINNAITVGRGYWVYLGNSTYTTSNIIIDATGQIVKKNFGNIPLTRTGPSGIQNGWNLIANPYPSPVSFARILNAMGSQSVNIDKTIYAWNPDLNGGNGDYAIYTQGVGSVPPVSSGGIDDNIPAGQGFFVRAINPVTLTPSENWKTTTNSQNNLLRTMQVNNNTLAYNDYPPTMMILEMKGPNNYDVYTAVALHPNATTNFDDLYDAVQVGSDFPAPQLMTVSNGMEYKINTFPPVNGTYSIEVKAITGVSGNYTIMPLNINNFSNGACLSLYDKFTGTTHNLSSGSYTFNLSDTTSVSRFILTITNNTVNASVSVLQQPTCSNDASGNALINITGSSYPYFLYLKDPNGSVLTTNTISTNTYTFTGLNGGSYFVEVASPSTCASNVINFSVAPTNTILPQSYFNLISNDTLKLDFSQPIVAVNQSTNSASILWELIGDGYSASTNTFSFMPSTEGEYILQLTAYNTCNDTSMFQVPVLIIPGPDSPSPFGYAPDGTPMQTSKLLTPADTNNEPNVMISKDEHGWLIDGNNVTDAYIQITDLMGRIIKFEKANLQDRYYIRHLNVNQQWIIVTVQFNNKTIAKKLFYE
ncbi:MAG: hypothetical protein N3F66_14890, partial [Spirochaetes bacterium]|nr:hypothetical protein [Spirochaetota bacterium]